MRQIFIFLVFLGFPYTVSSKERIKPFSNPQICKAGIATSVFRKVKGIKTISSQNNIVKISYVKSDGEKYTYTCKIQEKEILWKDRYMQDWNKNIKLFYQISSDGKVLKINAAFFSDKISESYTNSDF